ncbi:MAG: LytTR family DNA-binding domain-containing protein [Clostridium sp.]|nr:LytTR family DNA-binding domain-containing protein [Clostridium sp.]
MKIGICDDIKSELTRIKQFFSEKNAYENTEVLIFLPEELVQAIETDNFACDIMIMDIEFEMEHLNGITISKMLNQRFPKCQIVYLTSILEFAPDVYESEHCYFVMKNNMDAMLPLAMEKAIHIYNKILKQASIEVISNSHKVFIRQEDIYYIEKNNRQTVIHSKTGNFICYQSLRKIEAMLNDDMVRCHIGYIINLNDVSYLDNDEVRLSCGDSIPIGRTYKTPVKEAYMKHWLELV